MRVEFEEVSYVSLESVQVSREESGCVGTIVAKVAIVVEEIVSEKSEKDRVTAKLYDRRDVSLVDRDLSAGSREGKALACGKDFESGEVKIGVSVDLTGLFLCEGID